MVHCVVKFWNFYGEGEWRFLGTKRLTYTQVKMRVVCFFCFSSFTVTVIWCTLYQSILLCSILKVWVWFTAVALYSTQLQELCIARLVSFLLHVSVVCLIKIKFGLKWTFNYFVFNILVFFVHCTTPMPNDGIKKYNTHL